MPPPPPVAPTVSGVAGAPLLESDSAEMSSGAVDSGRVPIGQANAKVGKKNARTSSMRYSTEVLLCLF